MLFATVQSPLTSSPVIAAITRRLVEVAALVLGLAFEAGDVAAFALAMEDYLRHPFYQPTLRCPPANDGYPGLVPLSRQNARR